MQTIGTGFGGEVSLRVGALAVGAVVGVVTTLLRVAQGGSVSGGLVRGIASGVGVAVAFYLGLLTRVNM
jgi:hypothetical protein